jgi:hypothetical protein
MNVAAILGFWVLILGCISAPTQNAGQASAQGAQTNQSAPAENQPATARKRRKKKAAMPNCAATDAGANSHTDSANAAKPTLPARGAAGGATLPCPPPKKVVQNGGSNEPSIQLVGGETAQKTEEQRSIDELTAATTENLKKLEGRQLPASQQDTVNQIKQFMDQSKTAVAAGDLERGNNLATKARLLSDELVKP